MDELDEINGTCAYNQFNEINEINLVETKMEEELISNKENLEDGMSDLLKKELNPLDDRPFGKSNKFQFSEYPEGFDPNNPDAFVATAPKKTIDRKPLMKKKPTIGAKDKIEVEEKPKEIINENTQKSMNIEEKPLETSKPSTINEISDNKAIKKPKQPINKKITYNIEHPTNQPVENLDEKPVGGGKKLDEFSEEQMYGTSGKNIYDDLAIGGKSKFTISEYPEDYGMPPPDNNPKVEESQAPLASRIKSKVWKNRQSAFEELAQIFQTKGESDPAFNEYTGEFITFIGDSNPGCQEKALQAVFFWLERSRSISFDVKEFSKVLIDKCLGAGKPQIKKICLDTMCFLFEKSEKSAINEAIILSLNHKNQKTQCAGVAVIMELLANYGAKKLDYLKPFYPEVEKLAASTQASARTEAMNFYKEVFKWLGEAIRPFLLKLKKAQLDELEKFFTEWPKTPMKPLKEPEASAGGVSGGGQQEMLDAYDMVDAVDIFSKKFDEKWSDTVVAIPKWSDKKEKLDELVVAASVPKLAPNNYYHIPAMLKRVLNDNNATVACTGIKICGLLAKGIRKPFSSSAKMLFPMLLEKLKDKKTSTLDETKVAMDSFLYCLSIDEVIDDIKEALGQKVPSSKIYTLKWLDNFMEKKVGDERKKYAPTFKALVPAIKKLVDDGASDVRDTSLSSLGKIKGIFGESTLGNALSDMNPQKLQKLNDAASKFESKPAEPVKGAGAGLGGKNQISPNRMELELEEEEKVAEITSKPNPKGGSNNAQKPPAKTMQKSATQKTLAQNSSETSLVKSNSSSNNNAPNNKKPASAKGGANAGASSASNADAVSNKTYEECEGILRGMGLNDQFFTSLESSNWKEKVAALQNIQSNHTDILENNLEELLKVMKVKTKDWKESNLNTIKEILNLLKTTASMDNICFSKRSFWLVVPFLTDKLSDSKYVQSIEEIIQSLCRYIPPKFIISQLISNSDPKKASPKSTAEACNQISKLIDLVGSSNIPVMELIDFAKATLACTTPALRTAATALIKGMYQNIGKELLNFLNDVNPQQLKPLLAELDKVVPYTDAQKKSKISFLGEAANDVKEDARGGGNPFDSLPRADISNEANKLLKKLGDAQWKTRKEGLDGLESLLSSNNNRISSNNLHDLVACLKQKLNDPNKSLARGFITFIGKFAEACGKEVKQYSKTLLPALMSNLSDKQGMIRTDVLQAMDKFSTIIGADNIINLSPTYLANESFEMRSELIAWLIKNPESFPKTDWKPFVAPVLACLTDKNKEIRLISEQFLEKIAENTSIAPFSQAAKTLKPAVVQQLKPLFDKYGGFEEDQKRPSTAQPSGQGGGGAQAGDQKKPGSNGTAINNNNNNTKGVPASKSQSKLKTIVGNNLGKEDKGFKIFNKDKDGGESKENTKNSPSKEGIKQGNTSHIVASTTADNFYSNERLATSDSKKNNNFGKTSFIGNQTATNLQQQFNSMQRGSVIQAQGGYSDFGPDQLLADPQICAELKTQRVIRELEQMWPLDEICDELVEELIADFKMVSAEVLHKKLFSQDFKKHIDAANTIKKLTLTHTESIQEISDLIIKWAFLRLWGNNNFEVIMEILDMIEKVLGGFSQIEYSTIDFEAKITLALLRELLLKNDQMKMKVYNIIDCLLVIYPGEKISAFWGDVLIKTPLAQLRKEISLLYQSVLLKYCQRELIILSKIPEIVNNRDIITCLCSNFDRGYLIQNGFTESQLSLYNTSIQRARPSQSQPFGYTQEVENNMEQINAAFSYINSNPGNIPKSQAGTLKTQPANNGKPDEDLTKKMAGLTTGSQRNQTQGTPQFNNTQNMNFQNNTAKNLSVLNNVKTLNSASLYGNNSTVTTAQGPSSIHSSNSLKMITHNSKVAASNKQNSLIDPDTSSLNSSFSTGADGKGFSTISNMIGGPSSNPISSKPYALVNNQMGTKATTPSYSTSNLKPSEGIQKFQEFLHNLRVLEEGSVSQKIDALLVINNLISAGNEESKSILHENANRLISTILVVFNNSFDQRSNIPRQFVQYFLNIVHKMFSIKNLFKDITHERLYVLTDSMLNKLIIEDDNKPDNENESFVKPLNSIILRILENSNPNDLFLILWDLLIINRRKVTFARILGLIIKCILKLTKILATIIEQINVSQLLEKFHLYLVEFAVDQNKPLDDIGIKTIKTVLNELVKLLEENVWDFYEVIKSRPEPDNYIQKWIAVILKPNQNCSAPSPRMSNKTTFASGLTQQSSQINPPPQPPVRHQPIQQLVQQPVQQVVQQPITPTSQFQPTLTSNPQMMHGGAGFRQQPLTGGISEHFGLRSKMNAPSEQFAKNSSFSSQEDPEVRDIIEFLKKNPGYPPHLRMLNDKLAMSPGLNLNAYFADCPKQISDMILGNMQRIREGQAAENNFEQDKKPQAQFANYEDQQLNKLKDFNKGTSLSTMDYENFHNKINQIKQRYGKILENTEGGNIDSNPVLNNQSYLTLKENYSSYGNNPNFVPQQQVQTPQQPMQQQQMYQYEQQQPFTSSLFDDPKSYLQKSTQNLDYLNTSLNRVGGAGETFNKSPEFLQQKINDMKSKMSNLMGNKNIYSFGEKARPEE